MRKIAFVRMGPFPFANARMVEVLEQAFPDYEVETIDVLDLIKKRKHIVFINVIYMIRYYGIDLLFKIRKPWKAFFATPYIFMKIKKILNTCLSSKNYTFSFQIQSLFDASLPGLPHFVYTDHTHLANLYYAHSYKAPLHAESWIELEKTIYHNATLNFTRSTHISKSLVEQYICAPERVACVYTGSNAHVPDRPSDTSRYGQKNILFVGTDWQRKGGPELMEAFKIVLNVHPDARLTIVGCSPKLQLAQCQVVGRVPLQDVHQYYKHASIFCLPTKLEPFGIVFVEALHHKLPIVATSVGAIPDLVVDGENGYLVEPGNSKQLAGALINLLNDQIKCQEFGEAGFDLALRRYNWQNVGNLIRGKIEYFLHSES